MFVALRNGHFERHSVSDHALAETKVARASRKMRAIRLEKGTDESTMTPEVVSTPGLSLADIEVPTSLRARWIALGGAARASVAAFLGEPCPLTAGWNLMAERELPEQFARDLADGAAGFRIALPAMRRRIESIITTDHHASIRVRCTGTQTGPFFHVLVATQREVEFDVVHHIAGAGGEVTAHGIDLDLRSLIRNISSGPKRA